MIQSTFAQTILSRMPQNNNEGKDQSQINLRNIVLGLFLLMRASRSTKQNDDVKFSGSSNEYGLSEEEKHEEEIKRQEELEKEDRQIELLEEIRDGVRELKGTNKGNEQPTDQQGSITERLRDLITPRNTAAGVGALTAARRMAVGGAVAGGALAAVGGALTYRQLNRQANTSREEELISLESERRNGTITEEEYNTRHTQINTQFTENRGGAIGGGTGLVAGSLMGAKAGASIGMYLGPKGAVAGAAIGGVIGGISGTSVGRNIGGAIGSAVGNVRSFLGIKPETIEEIEEKNNLLRERDPQKFEIYSQEVMRNYESLLQEHSDRISSGEITEQDIEKIALIRTYENNRQLFKDLQTGQRMERTFEVMRKMVSFSPLGTAARAASRVPEIFSNRTNVNQQTENHITQETIQPIVRNITESASATDSRIEQLSRVITNNMTNTNSAIQTISSNNDRIITQPFTSSIHNKERTVNSILRSYN